MKIIVDTLESNNILVDVLRKDADVEIKKLKVGDFIISKDVVVERKTVDDFVNSLIDGRLFKQSKNMNINYSMPFFIIEGDFNSIFLRKISAKAIWSAIISLTIKNNARILFTSCPEETAQVLLLLAKKEQVHEKKELALRTKVHKMDLKERQQFLLEGLPGVGPKLANNLLRKFKSPLNVLKADEEELLKVDKIGPKKAKLIKKIIVKKYN